MTTHNGPAAALATLIILQLVMLFALFTQTGPHPPNAVAPFAIAPFLSVSLSVAVMAILFGATNTSAGSATAVIAALLALVSYGPQKWIDPGIAQIWPAVLAGEIAAVYLMVKAIAQLRGGRMVRGVESG